MEQTKYRDNLNPFTAIWTRPRETVRYVIEEKESNFSFLLIVLSGFVAVLIGNQGAEQGFPLLGVLLMALLVGPLAAIVGTSVGAGIYLLIGRLFKGQATYKEMFRAVLTSQITQIWLIPFILLWILLSPETYFLQAGEMPFENESPLSIILTLILSVVSIWTFFVQCKAIGEAHRLSAWKGFFIIAIPAIVFIAIVAVIIIAIVTAVL
ncbi:Yip1 family protein [Planococcus versutus]|uniref:Yip1 domain-containing protein n=1 Tax=Planococcus versutus TaxID=1302659 RepID=A0A1B1S1T5_9BACL|nr:Yip1 family protein [Planococcus versutus]ANU27152.1 hypothetical protein I858_009135 [Planococcus versutus]